MENEEEEIDFEELSKEYPLFFSSFEDLPKEKYYPSPKIPKPISDDPSVFLDFDDYMLNERISGLKFYPIDDDKNNTPNKTHLSKNLSNSPSLHSSTANTETNISHASFKNSTNKSSSVIKKRSNNVLNKTSSLLNSDHDDISELYNATNHKYKMSLIDIDNLDKETPIQPQKNRIKKSNIPPPPPPQTQLHSGYPLLFDFMPQNPQRHQKLKNGTEKTFYQNGDILVHFSSGKEKIYRQNLVITKFKNGDVLQEFLDGATAYRYGNTGTVELTLPDRTSIIQYPNGQREKRNPEGETIVKFSDGVFMKVDADGNWTMVKSKT